MSNNKTDSKKLTGRGLFWILFVSGFVPIILVLIALNLSVIALVVTADSIEHPNATSARLLLAQIASSFSDHSNKIRDLAKALEYLPLEDQPQEPEEIELLFREFLPPIYGYFTDGKLHFAQRSYPLDEDFKRRILEEISTTEKRRIAVEDSVNELFLWLRHDGDTTRFNGYYMDDSIFKANLPKIIDNIIDNSVFKRYFIDEEGAMYEPSPMLSRYVYLTAADEGKLIYERGPREEVGLYEYASRNFWYSVQITVYGKFNIESEIEQKLRYFNILFIIGLVMIVLGMAMLVRRQGN